MIITKLTDKDKDYPLIMCLVPNKEKYDLFSIDGAIVVPLFQVIDAISEVKADAIIRNGVKCCPTCMNPIEQEPETRWIPVSERLPEPYEQVLRTVKSYGWNCTDKTYVDIGSICPISTDVIAWQPLPAPYKESEG